MKLTKMVYVASPYSHKSKKIMKERCLAADKAIGKLQDLHQYAFIGPITQSARTVKYMQKKGEGFSDWKVRDLTYISRCDEVWVLDIPGWDKSIGVLAEIAFAKHLKLPIRFINHITYHLYTKDKVLLRII